MTRCVLCQGSPVLSLSELSKAPLHNGPPAPLPAPEGSSSRLSPPNVSALLDISLPGPPEDVLSQGEPATHISDSIIEIAISSGQYGEGAPTPGPRGPNLPPGVCTLAGHAPVPWSTCCMGGAGQLGGGRHCSLEDREWVQSSDEACVWWL